MADGRLPLPGCAACGGYRPAVPSLVGRGHGNGTSPRSRFYRDGGRPPTPAGPSRLRRLPPGCPLPCREGTRQRHLARSRFYRDGGRPPTPAGLRPASALRAAVPSLVGYALPTSSRLRAANWSQAVVVKSPKGACADCHQRKLVDSSVPLREAPQRTTQNGRHCAICAAPSGGCFDSGRGRFPGSCEPG